MKFTFKAFTNCTIICLGLFILFAACNSTREQEPDKKEETAVSSDDKYNKTISDYFLLLPDNIAGLSLEKRKETLNKKGTSTFLSYTVEEAEPTGEGGSTGGVNNQFALWEVDGEADNPIFAIVSSGGDFEPSSIKFFRFADNKWEKADIDFPSPKLKEVFNLSATADCKASKTLDGNKTFDGFVYNLPQKSEDNITAFISEAAYSKYSDNCGPLMETIEFKWTGKDFERVAAAK